MSDALEHALSRVADCISGLTLHKAGHPVHGAEEVLSRLLCLYQSLKPQTETIYHEDLA